jgi:hypothetical protein
VPGGDVVQSLERERSDLASQGCGSEVRARGFAEHGRLIGAFHRLPLGVRSAPGAAAGLSVRTSLVPLPAKPRLARLDGPLSRRLPTLAPSAPVLCRPAPPGSGLTPSAACNLSLNPGCPCLLPARILILIFALCCVSTHPHTAALCCFPSFTAARPPHLALFDRV